MDINAVFMGAVFFLGSDGHHYSDPSELPADVTILDVVDARSRNDLLMRWRYGAGGPTSDAGFDYMDNQRRLAEVIP